MGYLDRLFSGGGTMPFTQIHRGGFLTGDVAYCVADRRIFYGGFPDGNVAYCYDDYDRIYEGSFTTGNCVACVDSDGRIYRGSFAGDCIGCIYDRCVYFGSGFPDGMAAFYID